MNCPYCGGNIKKGSKFCGTCGRELQQCPVCGQIIKAGLPFCMQCGSQLQDNLSNRTDSVVMVSATNEEPTYNSIDRSTTFGGSQLWTDNPRPAGNSRYGVCNNCGEACGIGETLCSSCRKKKRIWIGVIAGLGGILAVGILIVVLVFSGVIGGGSKLEEPTQDEFSVSSQTQEETESSQSSQGNSTQNFQDNTNQQSSINDYGIYEGIDEVERNESGYILPYSDSRYIDKKELEKLSKEECSLARNELYARHGRKFRDESVQAYFDSCPWYIGSIEPEDFNEGELFNEYEIYNRDLIKAYEAEMGYTK